MYKIHIVAHATICVTCAQVRLKLADFCKREGLYCFIFRLEQLAHFHVHLFLVHVYQVCRQGPGYHFTFLNLEGHRAETYVAAMAAGIYQADAVAHVYGRPVVM